MRKETFNLKILYELTGEALLKGWATAGRHLIHTLVLFAETQIISPEISHHPLNVNTGFTRGNNFNKKQRIVIILDLFLPFEQIARPGIIGRRQIKKIVGDKRLAHKVAEILLADFHIVIGIIQKPKLSRFRRRSFVT